MKVNPLIHDLDLVTLAQHFAASNLDSESLPHANKLFQCIRTGLFDNWKKTIEEIVRPEFGPEPYYKARQFTALLSKVPFPGIAAKQKERAISSFFSAERKCRRTNRRLQFYREHPDRMPPTMRVLLTRAREEVRRMVGGDLSDGTLLRVLNLSRPGSGTAVGTRNAFRVSLPFKLGDTDLCCTRGALPYAQQMFRRFKLWGISIANIDWMRGSYSIPYVVTTANKVTFVPKDVMTFRTIAIEPALNVMLQLGVHEHFTDRLTISGNCIKTQGRNQELALKGSMPDCAIATIDLSSASDTMSYEFVRWMLPPMWFAFLSDIRSEYGCLEGEVFRYEKFSSMGNGFTFALETMLFLALARAANSMCGGLTASTYGDDIIVSSESSLLLTEALRFCGFSVNLAKSFYFGDFRESCGFDYWQGLRVTPQYVRKYVPRMTDLFGLLNRIDPVFNFSSCRQYVLSCIKSSGGKLVFGPPDEDTSGHLFSSWKYLEGSGSLKYVPRYQRWAFKTIRFVPKGERVPELFAYLAALFGMQGKRAQLRELGMYRVTWQLPGNSPALPRIFRE